MATCQKWCCTVTGKLRLCAGLACRLSRPRKVRAGGEAHKVGWAPPGGLNCYAPRMRWYLLGEGGRGGGREEVRRKMGQHLSYLCAGLLPQLCAGVCAAPKPMVTHILLFNFGTSMRRGMRRTPLHNKKHFLRGMPVTYQQSGHSQLFASGHVFSNELLLAITHANASSSRPLVSFYASHFTHLVVYLL